MTLKKHLIQSSHWRKKRKEGINVNKNSLKNLKSFRSNKPDESKMILSKVINDIRYAEIIKQIPDIPLEEKDLDW